MCHSLLHSRFPFALLRLGQQFRAIQLVLLHVLKNMWVHQCIQCWCIVLFNRLPDFGRRRRLQWALVCAPKDMFLCLGFIGHGDAISISRDHHQPQTFRTPMVQTTFVGVVRPTDKKHSKWWFFSQMLGQFLRHFCKVRPTVRVPGLPFCYRQPIVCLHRQFRHGDTM